MSLRKTFLLWLAFGTAGLLYAAWKGKQEREQAVRRRIAELDKFGF